MDISKVGLSREVKAVMFVRIYARQTASAILY
jgi:hypothetical protein